MWKSTKKGRLQMIVRSILFLLAFSMFAQSVIVRDTMAYTVPQELKKTITFIFTKSKSDKTKLIPNGTGFFVGVKAEDNPKISINYLVTAKHVLENKETGDFFDSIFIRLNKKQGGVKIEEIPLKGKTAAKFFFHEEPDVDIAIIPILPSDKLYDFKILSQEMLVTNNDFKEANIGEGDEVFFMGLFTPFIGSFQNYPVVRFGRIALVTEEKIGWANEELELYLIEASSFGGNSGAPVFFHFGPIRTPGLIKFSNKQDIRLAGIMKGFFSDSQPISVVETEAKKMLLSKQNMGIAAVVPSYKLYEILFSEEQKAFRKQRFENK